MESSRINPPRKDSVPPNGQQGLPYQYVQQQQQQQPPPVMAQNTQPPPYGFPQQYAGQPGMPNTYAVQGNGYQPGLNQGLGTGAPQYQGQMPSAFPSTAAGNPPQFGMPPWQPPQPPQQYQQYQQYQPQRQAQMQPQMQPQMQAHMQYQTQPQMQPQNQLILGKEGEKWAPFAVTNGVPRIVGGRKKALLIGINYTGTRSALRGCVNDVAAMRKLLIEQYCFADNPQHMVVLTDDDSSRKDPALLPLRRSIEMAIGWLVAGVQAGDSLFLHFSGHGSQKADADGDEDDGYDETICPLDYQKAGEIVDDWLNAKLVRVLPEGVQLVAVFDCCHSGTMLDLPLLYLPDGRIKEGSSGIKQAGSSFMEAGAAYMSGNMSGVLGGIMGMFNGVQRSLEGNSGRTQRAKKVAVQKGSQAVVITFSGCKDRQTSADTNINSRATGAMSWALIKAVREKPNMTFGQVLGRTRDLLRGSYQQVPQLGAGRRITLDRVFAL